MSHLRRRTVLLFGIVVCLTAVAHAQQGMHATAPAITQARELIRQHKYFEAQAIIDSVLRRKPHDRAALLERGRLLVQAWRLDAADSIAAQLPDDAQAVVLSGRIQLLKKNYDEALRLARTAQEIDTNSAEAFLLEADVHFWNQQPDLTEAPLQRALELDPDNADARFAYGYAIWRRVDARQLPAMAEQWNRALASDPLHYVTHWHFGNGHTHLTYADYAQPTDSVVRVALSGVDSLVASEKITQALARTRELETQYPQSLLPTLARGSIFYMAYDLPVAERLDSAQAAFWSLLARKQNYGPAHNGLAAVIKQRQLQYVGNYDSLERAIASEPLPDDSAFTRVFKDLSYYPGTRVERMARQQLGPALAYIPFIARLGYTYTVFPLHRDLTDALNTPFFRTSTTFDHRQWMDIRGSGGNNASAGIEYVERGSHQERVVLLHEYVHQFHGSVLTDRESRRIRQLYYDAMANNRTLDYYAANNESEFLAQSYEAYLSPVKVHPLNHKAMNTRDDLIRKDPGLFAYLDSLIMKNRAYLAGDYKPMRSNWAQVYVTLAARERGRAPNTSDPGRWIYPQALVDTALMHDPAYVPALLEQASLHQAQQNWSEAADALDAADDIDPDHAPTVVARAELLRQRAVAEGRRPDLDTQIRLYRRAVSIETDLAERAELNEKLRELYFDAAKLSDALAVADEYVRTAPAPSTYLRDRRDEAAAFAAAVRSSIGYGIEVAGFFQDIVARKPQHFGLRAQAALALQRAGRSHEAVKMIEDGQRILGAGRQRRTDYLVILAGALANAGSFDSARAVIASIEPEERAKLADDDRVLLARTMVFSGMVDAGAKLVPADSSPLAPRVRAERLQVLGYASLRRRELNDAARLFRQALALNPYHFDARAQLIEVLVAQKKRREAGELADEGTRVIGRGFPKRF